MPAPAETVAPGVRRVLAPNPGMMTGTGTNTYLLGERDVAVLDPGPDDPGHLEALRAAAEGGGGKIVAVWLSHYHVDHATGAATLARATGAPVRAWRSPNTAHRPSGWPPPDLPVADGDTLVLDGETYVAHHAPGHASDHLCYFRPSDGLLFTGDVVVGAGTVVIAPPDGDMATYWRTLERLLALAPRRLAPGHGPMIEDAPGKIREYLAHRLAREAQLLGLLAQGTRSIDWLVEAVYPLLTTGLRPVAAQQVLAHLLKLEAEGRARRAGDGWTAV